MDEQKLEAMLRVMLWMLFDLKNQSEVTLDALPKTIGQRVREIRNAQFTESGDDMLKAFFEHLRHFAVRVESSERASEATSDELWDAFRLAEMRSTSASVFEDELRGLWDVL